MAEIIVSLTPTTEIQAVNAMLSAIGIAPVTVIDGATQADVEMAVNILRATTKEIQSRRWRFNTEYGYTLSPSTTYTQDGVLLNIFTVPSNLSSFVLSAESTQKGIDAIIRPSRSYVPGTMVFYDRLNSRDGFVAATFATLKIDPVWMFDFEDTPETARWFITVCAARRFVQQIGGDTELAAFSVEDETKAFQALTEDQQERASVVGASDAQTETDALNLLLTSTAQEPVISADRPLSRQAREALNILRAAVREVCARGWSFNVEFGMELAPTGTLSWTWRDTGVVETLNIFTPPSALLGFTMTDTLGQQGAYYLDVVIRPSKVYQVASAYVPVFYDRALNRDGFTNDFLYINPVWLLSFSDLPEEAKRYCLVLAARRYATSKVGSRTAEMFSEQDEQMAERELKRRYGDQDDYNIFDNWSVRQAMGGRSFGSTGIEDGRASAGHS